MTSSASPRPPFSRRTLMAGAVALPALGAVAAPALAEPTEGILDVALADLPVHDVDGAPARQIDQDGASMIGCSWSEAEPEQIAARGLSAETGEWTEWLALEPITSPETGEPAPSTQAVWVGVSTAMQVRALAGGTDVTDQLVAHVITTVVQPGDEQAHAAPDPDRRRTRTLAAAAAPSTYRPGVGAPAVVSRVAWGADESLVKNGPAYASELKAAVVHHTEGTNSYTLAQVPGILRGILSYHTQTQGWSDIGYNALVDKYGYVYEGRAGGLDRHVVGAHATGSNTGSVGVCMIGSYTSTAPSGAMLDAVADVISWKLGACYVVDVFSQTVLDGRTVGRVIGHKDCRSVSTDCPGTRGYAALPEIRTRVQSRLGAWRDDSLQAYLDAGGRGELGTVTRVRRFVGDWTVTALTNGLVLSTANVITAHASPFGASWQPAWGRPITAASTVDGKLMQGFENGTAVRTDGRDALIPTRFRDVPLNLQFATEIEELASRGITTGYPDGTYRPLSQITRDAMVAFVHRAKGSPAFTAPSTSPFRDMTPQMQFYKEICWAAATGIAQGFPDGTFRPAAPVERQAVAAFLYRAAGSPSVPAGAPTFSDVARDSPFRAAISWLAGNGITTGWPDGTFRPSAPITRDAMAAFMIRWMRLLRL